MKKLRVYYSGWGEDFHLADLAESGRNTLFEYTSVAKARGLEVSPHQFPLATTGTVARPTHQRNALVGFINDALPDGWGLRLMDRALEARGRRPAEVTPLERLMIVGDNAFGALRFAPADTLAADVQDLDLMALARETQKVIAGQATEFLPVLLHNGSPQGARPKASIWMQTQTGRMSTAPFDDAEPWLVKFPAASEHPEVCAIEKIYAELASEGGIMVPPTIAIELKEIGSAAFAVARFDRYAGQRIAIQSFAGMLDVDFSTAHTGYESLLVLAKRVTRDQREVEKLYRRCVFNVLYNNRDDHLKNFAFQCDRDGLWRLTPAYDLTFSEGPGGEHWTTVMGQGRRITRDHLLALASSASIKKAKADAIISEVAKPAAQWSRRAARMSITKETWTMIGQRIRDNVAACARL